MMAIRMGTDEYRQQHEAAESSESAARHDELYEAHRRIQQLERYNAELAAQIDRMTPVTDAAESYCECDQYGWDKTAARRVLVTMVHRFKQQMAALAQGAGG